MEQEKTEQRKKDEYLFSLFISFRLVYYSQCSYPLLIVDNEICNYFVYNFGTFHQKDHWCVLFSHHFLIITELIIVVLKLVSFINRV